MNIKKIFDSIKAFTSRGFLSDASPIAPIYPIEMAEDGDELGVAVREALIRLDLEVIFNELPRKIHQIPDKFPTVGEVRGSSARGSSHDEFEKMMNEDNLTILTGNVDWWVGNQVVRRYQRGNNPKSYPPIMDLIDQQVHYWENAWKGHIYGNFLTRHASDFDIGKRLREKDHWTFESPEKICRETEDILGLGKGSLNSLSVDAFLTNFLAGKGEFTRGFNSASLEATLHPVLRARLIKAFDNADYKRMLNPVMDTLYEFLKDPENPTIRKRLVSYQKIRNGLNFSEYSDEVRNRSDIRRNIANSFHEAEEVLMVLAERAFDHGNLTHESFRFGLPNRFTYADDEQDSPSLKNGAADELTAISLKVYPQFPLDGYDIMYNAAKKGTAIWRTLIDELNNGDLVTPMSLSKRGGSDSLLRGMKANVWGSFLDNFPSFANEDVGELFKAFGSTQTYFATVNKNASTGKITTGIEPHSDPADMLGMINLASLIALYDIAKNKRAAWHTLGNVLRSKQFFTHVVKKNPDDYMMRDDKDTFQFVQTFTDSFETVARVDRVDQKQIQAFCKMVFGLLVKLRFLTETSIKNTYKSELFGKSGSTPAGRLEHDVVMAMILHIHFDNYAEKTNEITAAQRHYFWDLFNGAFGPQETPFFLKDTNWLKCFVATNPYQDDGVPTRLMLRKGCDKSFAACIHEMSRSKEESSRKSAERAALKNQTRHDFEQAWEDSTWDRDTSSQERQSIFNAAEEAFYMKRDTALKKTQSDWQYLEYSHPAYDFINKQEQTVYWIDKDGKITSGEIIAERPIVHDSFDIQSGGGRKIGASIKVEQHNTGIIRFVNCASLVTNKNQLDFEEYEPIYKDATKYRVGDVVKYTFGKNRDYSIDHEKREGIILDIIPFFSMESSGEKTLVKIKPTTRVGAYEEVSHHIVFLSALDT